jgi:hypothetical protein
MKISSFMSDKDIAQHYEQEDNVVNFSVDSPFEKKKFLSELLLKKPDIEIKTPKVFGIKKGTHDSKDYVSELQNRIKIHDDIVKYVAQVRGCRYNPSKRQEIIISKANDVCYLNIYEDRNKDSGFGTVVELKCSEIHEAVSITKYIVHRIKFLKKYNISVKEHYREQEH